MSVLVKAVHFSIKTLTPWCLCEFKPRRAINIFSKCRCVNAARCLVPITIMECGFRQNWLSFSQYSPWSIRWGKKFSIINHIPVIKRLVTRNSLHISAVYKFPVFCMDNNGNTFFGRSTPSFSDNSLTPKRCMARQSWACWLKPCSAWRTHRWRSGADEAAAELCGPWGWLRWYCNTS